MTDEADRANEAERTGDDGMSAHVAHPRGRLKVFLGMAAGVGKSYTMLSEAQRRASRGEDVVIGYLEPHDRPETMALAEGLERIPPKRIEYRGATFTEMDTAAVLARRPQWALVDELAHTNVPGTEHLKRWESVEDLLDAGINVITTVNIQHLESLNDAVRGITGVQVRETFPDRLIAEADEVVVVDLTPEALINRLRRGVVYDLEKVDQALVSFFTPERLAALRELALRQTADEVDDQIIAALGDASEVAWAGREVVVVCVTAREESIRLVSVQRPLPRRSSADGAVSFAGFAQTGDKRTRAGEPGEDGRYAARSICSLPRRQIGAL